MQFSMILRGFNKILGMLLKRKDTLMTSRLPEQNGFIQFSKL